MVRELTESQTTYRYEESEEGEEGEMRDVLSVVTVFRNFEVVREMDADRNVRVWRESDPLKNYVNVNASISNPPSIFHYNYDITPTPLHSSLHRSRPRVKQHHHSAS